MNLGFCFTNSLPLAFFTTLVLKEPVAAVVVVLLLLTFLLEDVVRDDGLVEDDEEEVTSEHVEDEEATIPEVPADVEVELSPLFDFCLLFRGGGVSFSMMLHAPLAS